MDAACRRCKADLSLLVAVEETRASELVRSAEAIMANDGDAALQHAETAHHLRADRDSWRRLATAHLLRRDFERALTCRAAAL
ncbi:MAG: hypothetical protein EXS16_14410 [Gemmataceae bacterium]|nr:hypothetical protein [Gemmataceae bacterium]